MFTKVFERLPLFFLIVLTLYSTFEFLLNLQLFGRSIMTGNTLLYKFAVLDRNLFGCCSKGCPAPRLGYKECFSLAASFYLVHVAERKWRSVSIETVGEGLGIWFPGNVSDLFYWKIGTIDVLRRCCSGKVTFSFSPDFIKQFYNYV
jgi:hypothetical protein